MANTNDLVDRINRSTKSKVLFENLPEFEIPKTLRELAKNGNEKDFKKIEEAHLAFLARVNYDPKLKEEVRIQSLDFIEFMALVGDAGYMGLGIPTEVSDKRKAYALKMFQKLYGDELPKTQH
mgnify:FL=1